MLNAECISLAPLSLSIFGGLCLEVEGGTQHGYGREYFRSWMITAGANLLMGISLQRTPFHAHTICSHAVQHHLAEMLVPKNHNPDIYGVLCQDALAKHHIRWK